MHLRAAVLPAHRGGTAPSVPPPLADGMPTWMLAFAGVALTVLASNRVSIALAGWLAPVPLAILATRLRGWRGRLTLLGVCVAGLTLQTLKIVSPPVPFAFAFAFGVPIGSASWLTLVLWDAIRRRAGPAWSIHAFAALTAIMDYVGYALSPGGAWASSVNGQVENLPLLQLAALGGLTLVALVMAWAVGAAVALLVTPPDRLPWRHALAVAGLVVVAHGWGALRLDATESGAATVRVAAVTVDFPDRMSSMEDLRGNLEVLFERSELAARRGAQIVVWNELATLLDPREEPMLVARGSTFAGQHGVDLVMAYGTIESRMPFRIQNAYAWIGADGHLIERYRKHFLPPGEPVAAGDAPLRAHDRPWGRTAGAICYDYDSPALARVHARDGAALVVLPSSDWRGIDPQHALMARVRAIEGGMSVVRPVRAATSMAFDPYGRVRASMSAWERNERVMLATVPVARVPTPYAAVGDWPAVIAAALAVSATVAAVCASRDQRATATGAVD